MIYCSKRAEYNTVFIMLENREIRWNQFRWEFPLNKQPTKAVLTQSDEWYIQSITCRLFANIASQGIYRPNGVTICISLLNNP